MIEPFKPVTREEAASILDISLTTLDAMIASEAFPAPRQIGECRKLYWHPDIFYGALHRWLGVDPASIVLPALDSVVAARDVRRGKGGTDSKAVPASRDSETAAPARARRYGDALARQAERLEALNQCSTP